MLLLDPELPWAAGHSDTKINQIFLRNGVGTSAKPLPYAIAASITADLKQLLLAFPLPFHKPVVCLLGAGGEGRGEVWDVESTEMVE